nr:hypothetical protein [Tanacetum cinerariifolium]
LQSVEERLADYKKNEVVFEDKINILNHEVKLRDNALVEYTKKLVKAEKQRDELKLTLEKYENSSKSLNTLLESQVSDKLSNVVWDELILTEEIKMVKAVVGTEDCGMKIDKC